MEVVRETERERHDKYETGMVETAEDFLFHFSCLAMVYALARHAYPGTWHQYPKSGVGQRQIRSFFTH